MKYHTIELNGQEISFRLTSEDCCQLEEKTKVKLLDYIQDYSIITVINLLWYMRRGVEKSYTKNDTYKYFDELTDNEWSLEDIMMKIVYPCCQVSGLLTKSDLEKIQDKITNRNEETIQQENQ